MGLNVDLARKVLAYIEAHPEQHEQTTYVEPAEGSTLDPGFETGEEPDVVAVAENVKPTGGEYLCMTTACIAGWSVALAGPEAVRKVWDSLADYQQDQEPWFETGRMLLGLTRPEATEIFLEFDEEAALDYLATMVRRAEETG